MRDVGGQLVEQFHSVVGIEVLEQGDDVVATQTFEQLAANGRVEALEHDDGLVLG